MEKRYIQQVGGSRKRETREADGGLPIRVCLILLCEGKAFRWEHLQSLICGETVRDNMALELSCDSETGKLCTLWEQLQVQQAPSGPEERRSSQPQTIIRLHLTPVSNLYHFMAQNCPFFFPL